MAKQANVIGVGARKVFIGGFIVMLTFLNTPMAEGQSSSTPAPTIPEATTGSSSIVSSTVIGTTSLAPTTSSTLVPSTSVSPSTGAGPTSAGPTTTLPIPAWPPAASWDQEAVGLSIWHRQYGRVEAPRIATDVSVKMTGPMARVRFTQRYVNPSKLWVDGRYAFETPMESTIDTMRVLVGDRAFESQIYTVRDGNKVFELAKKKGTSVARLEGGWNGRWFYGQVANIAPGDQIVVEIEYTQQLRSFDGTWKLTVPTALATSSKTRDAVPTDAKEANVGQRPDGQTSNLLHAVVDVSAGMAVKDVTVGAVGHSVAPSDKGFVVTIPWQQASVGQDLSVTWKAVSDAGIQVSGAIETNGPGGRFGAILITPPVGQPATGGRDVVFVMPPVGLYDWHNYSSLLTGITRAIDSLQPNDRYDVITGVNRSAFNALKSATPENRETALATLNKRTDELWIDEDKDGNYDEFDWDRWDREWDEQSIDKVLIRAFAREPRPEGKLDVVLMTDGSDFWSSGGLLSTLKKVRGPRERVHLVVFDDNPNYAYLDAIARAGHGSYVVLETADQVTKALTHFISVLGSPVITDLKVGPKGGPYAISPEVLPGHQTALLFPMGTNVDTVEATGVIGGKQWRWEQKIAAGSSADGIGGVWATQAICDLSVQESVEWFERLDAEWEAFFTRFERETGQSYWSALDAQWLAAYNAAPKDASGMLVDFEAFWESFHFVSPIPEPKASREYDHEEEALALRHHVIATGLTMLVAVDPKGPRRASDTVESLETVLAKTPASWHIRDVFGGSTDAFAQTFTDDSIRSAFTGVVEGRGQSRADSPAESPANLGADLAITGSNSLGYLVIALFLLGSGIIALRIRKSTD
jgi:Vault protein inter-alpha-trypsin domain